MTRPFDPFHSIPMHPSAGRRNSEDRIDRIRGLATEHIDVVSKRYPRLERMLEHDSTRPNMTEFLHRDFATFKDSMRKAGIKASRDEIASAFGQALREHGASLKTMDEPQFKPQTYHHLVEAYHIISHSDPDLRGLQSPPSGEIIPVTEHALSAAAATGATNFLRGNSAFEDQNPHPEALMRMAVMAGASKALGAVEQAAVDPAKVLTPDTFNSIASAVVSAVRAERPDVLRNVSPSLASAHTALLFGGALRRRVDDRSTTVKAQVARSLASVPTIQNPIETALRDLKVPQEHVDTLAHNLNALNGTAPHTDATRTSAAIVRSLNAIATHFGNSKLPTSEVGNRLHALCVFIAGQKHHPHLEAALTDLRIKLEGSTSRALHSEMRKRGIRPGGSVDYARLYTESRKLDLMGRFQTAVSVATGVLAEKDAERRVKGR